MRCYRSRRRSQSVAGQNGGRPRHIIAVKELEESATHAQQAGSEVQETEILRFLLWLGRGNPPLETNIVLFLGDCWPAKRR
jgi:hypothetical protein